MQASIWQMKSKDKNAQTTTPGKTNGQVNLQKIRYGAKLEELIEGRKEL